LLGEDCESVDELPVSSGAEDSEGVSDCCASEMAVSMPVVPVSSGFFAVVVSEASETADESCGAAFSS
jgi:hypothetical protein